MAAITQISRIQHRSGLYRELPSALNEAELGWALDTRQLFIGNGPIHPGNTEIITQHTPASSFNFSLKSPIAYQQLALAGAAIGVNPFVASTGFVEDSSYNDLDPTSFNPTIRSFQEKFDEIVSAKDYGAVGDGIKDDTGSIVRAVRDLYSEEFGAIGSNPDAAKRNVAIHLPAGVYRIRHHIPGIPGLTLLGDPGKTIILLDIEISTDENNDAVLISADSYGQIDLDMGQQINSVIPEFINASKMFFYGISFQSNQLPDVLEVEKRQIIRLARTTNATFQKCTFDFVGTDIWQNGDSILDAPTAILITKLGETTESLGKLNFIDCSSSGCAHDFNFIDATSDVLISGHKFNGKLLPCKVGYSSTYDSNVGTAMIYRNPADSLGSTNISIEHSIFSDYVGYALDVFGSSKAVKSFANRYTGSGKSIRFGSSTSYCSSMSDWFDNVTLASCGTSSPRIDNLSLLNTVFNAQDFVTIPNGIQELHVCGNITVSGSILVTPPAVTSLTLVTVAYPNSNLPQPNSFKGNSIIMDYAMRIPNGGNQILRTGTFKIIYSMSDNTPSATGVAVQYSDDYVEVGGGNSGSGLTLTTQFDNANQNIIIKVTSTIGTPTTKVIINAMSI